VDHLPRYRDFGHLERDVAAMAHGLGADLDRHSPDSGSPRGQSRPFGRLEQRQIACRGPGRRSKPPVDRAEALNMLLCRVGAHLCRRLSDTARISARLLVIAWQTGSGTGQSQVERPVRVQAVRKRLA
jgi:hypothetical protein